MYRLTAFFSLFCLVSLSLLPALPLPQDESGKVSKVQDDLDFAVNLARFRYFDLANDFVDSIKKEKLSNDEKEALSLTNASILKLASENTTSADDRLKFYQQAIAQFKEFVEYNTHHPRYDQVRIDLGEVYINLGRFQTDGLDSAQDAETRETLKKEAEDNFRKGIQYFNDAGSSLRDKAEAYEEAGEDILAQESFNAARETDYKKGVGYYYWGLIYSAGEFNREDYLNRAINTLDDYIWDSPEGDFFVLWAYLHQAMVYVELGNFDDALDLAEQVYDPTTGIDLNQATLLAPEYAKLITDLVETAKLQVARILIKMGSLEKVDQVIDAMVQEFQEKKLALSPIGHEARLEQAKALLEMGTPEAADKAAQICKNVGDLNPSNTVGQDAKIILKDIIAGAGSRGTGDIALSPDVLYSAADGSHLERMYLSAIQGYMNVFAACKTKQLKEAFIGKTWYAIGQCYSQMNNHIEASIAFEQGFTDPVGSLDKTHFERNAMSWYNSLSKRHKETRSPQDEKIKKEARNKLVQLNVSTDLRFMIANDKFNKALTLAGDQKNEAMQDALDEFKQMDTSSKLYERSMIYIARCYMEMGNYDEALKQFDAFITYVGRSAIPATGQQRTLRNSALAEEAYWRAENNIKLEKYEDALASIEGFEDRFKAQKDFFPAISYNRVICKLGLEKFDEAEVLFNGMKKSFPDSTRVSSAAYYIGIALIQKADSLKPEEDSAPSKDFLSFRKKGTEYMRSYCEQSGYDSFTNLKNVCEWYAELGTYGEKGALESARDLYKRLLKEYGKDPNYLEEVNGSVYKGYGKVLLEMRDFKAAKPIWLKVLSLNTKSTTVLRNTAFCMGGWIEYQGPDFVEIPGTGDYAPDPAEKRSSDKIYLDTALGIWKYLLRGIDHSGDKYTPAWWEAKFYTIYSRYRAAGQYPDYLDQALAVIKNQKLFQPEMGGPEWRPKFSFVEKQIKAKQRGN